MPAVSFRTEAWCERQTIWACCPMFVGCYPLDRQQPVPPDLMLNQIPLSLEASSGKVIHVWKISISVNYLCLPNAFHVT